MSKKKKTIIAVIAILAITIVGLGVGVVAKYISYITATGTATVAKWAFTTDNTSGSVTCTVDGTYDGTTLVNGKIAPGTSGKCPISISNATSEVAINYTIEPDGEVTNKPTNLKFYKDAAHTVPFSADAKITSDTPLAPGAEAQLVYVYWNWEYETGTDADDLADTTDGTNASTMTMKFKVTGTQVHP